MRHIHRDIWTDPFFGPLPWEFQKLWLGLVNTLADDQGRLEDNVASITRRIFPYDIWLSPDVVERGLWFLAKHNKVIRYSAADGRGVKRRLIQIVNWWRYQSSATQMHRSAYPAPRGWVDRWHVKRGNTFNFDDRNWHLIGGLRTMGGADKRGGVSRPSSTGPTQDHGKASTGPALAKRKEEEESKKKRKVKSRERIPPSNPPPSESNESGRMEKQEIVAKILRGAAFRDTRRIATVSNEVATRINGGDIRTYVLASFAGAFASGKSNDPVAVAVHQLEVDRVNPAFYDPALWTSVPAQILRAAGIDDVRTYATRIKAERFLNG